MKLAINAKELMEVLGDKASEDIKEALRGTVLSVIGSEDIQKLLNTITEATITKKVNLAIEKLLERDYQGNAKGEAIKYLRSEVIKQIQKDEGISIPVIIGQKVREVMDDHIAYNLPGQIQAYIKQETFQKLLAEQADKILSDRELQTKMDDAVFKFCVRQEVKACLGTMFKIVE
jgi:uncharacterized protein YbcI